MRVSVENRVDGLCTGFVVLIGVMAADSVTPDTQASKRKAVTVQLQTLRLTTISSGRSLSLSLSLLWWKAVCCDIRQRVLRG
jgi:hypothetical protein